FPSGWIPFTTLPVPPIYTPSLLPCSGFNYCPWHGTNVVGAGMGVPDNNHGGAGPAGPVARPITDFTTYDFAVGIVAIGEATLLGADIINMSYGAPVPAALSWTVIPFDLVTLGTRDLLGVLIFASAGNDNA